MADSSKATDKSARYLNINTAMSNQTIDPTSTMDVTDRSSPAVNTNKCNSELIKYQGMRWDEVFDFEKILSELRTAENQLKSTSINLTSDNKHLHQVKRLSGSDMAFYGIAPKQDANVVVVCEVCNATLNPVGLSRHMMQQHPAVWNNVSNKVPGVQSHVDSPIPAIDTTIESATEPLVIASTSAEAAASSIASTLSASTSSLSLTHHTLSSRSKSSSGGRSRNKTKHSSTTSSSGELVHKSSKKNLHSSSISNLSSVGSFKTSGGSNPFETDQAIAVYSSSSNSSCSLPSTPNKAGVVQPLDTLSLSVSVSVDNVPRSTTDAREKLHVENFTFSKKKTKSPCFIGQESIDSSTSSSSSEYDRSTGSQISAPPKLSSPKTNKIPAAIARTINRGNAHHYEKHISELDRAVSSITGGHEERLDVTSPPNVDIKDPKLSIFYKKRKLNNVNKVDKTHVVTTISHNNKIHSHTSSHHSSQSSSRSRDEKPNLVRHSLISDEKISADRAERKLQHEHRHSKERHNSTPSLEKPSTSHKHFAHPGAKRIRLEESSPIEKLNSQHKTSKKIITQEEQPTVFKYEESSKIYIQKPKQIETEQKFVTECEIQQPISINTTQFQHLLYQQQQQQQQQSQQQQQQQHYDYNSIIITGDLQQQLIQPNYEQSTGVEVIEQMNEEKPIQLLEKEESSVPSAIAEPPTYDLNACNILANSFQLDNIHSLTDDADDEEDHLTILPNAEQYELPANDDRILYAISPENEVTIVNNQGAAEVKTEVIESTSELSNIDNDTIWKNVFDPHDIDVENFDITKSKSHNNANDAYTHSIVSDDTRFIKKEHEDLNGNILTYPGIPRPLAMNTFGLVKYPQAIAATFRKTVLSTRKANNSPTTLNGNNANIGARFAPNIGGKVATNYFTALPGGSSSSLNNEFSFGNITVSNSPLSQQPSTSTYGLHRQHSAGGGTDLSFGPSTSASASVQPSTSQRAHQKSSTVTLNSLNGSLKYGSPSSLSPGMQNSNFTLSSPSYSGKSSFASNSTVTSERPQFQKRSIIANTDIIDKYNIPYSNSLADMLNFGKSLLEVQQVEATSVDGQESSQEPINRFQHIEEFYERRQNLLDLSEQNDHNRKLLINQHLARTYSDCSFDNLSQAQYKRNTTQNTDIYV